MWYMFRGQITHHDFRGILSDYRGRAEKEPGYILVSLEEACSFHLPLKRSGNMKDVGPKSGCL
jgi:hypothetical protein